MWISVSFFTSAIKVPMLIPNKRRTLCLSVNGQGPGQRRALFVIICNSLFFSLPPLRKTTGYGLRVLPT